MSDERLIEAALDRVTEACLKDGCADMFKKLMDGVAKGSRDQKEQLAAERAKVQSLSEVIESQKQTHDALIKKCRELEAQNLELFNKSVNVAWLETQSAVLREALEKVDNEKDGISFTCANAVVKALSLTPSEAAERVRNKDNIITMLLNTVKWIDGYVHQYVVVSSPKDGESVLKCKTKEAIEAARAAGVTTEENQ